MKPDSFIQIPNYVSECQGLSHTERALFGHIKSLARSRGHCYATNKYLANKIHRAPDTIRRLLANLKKYRIVTVQLILDPGTHQVLERRIFINKNRSERGTIAPEIEPETYTETTPPILPYNLQNQHQFVTFKPCITQWVREPDPVKVFGGVRALDPGIKEKINI